MTNLLPFIRNDVDMLRLVRETAQRSENIYLSQHAKERMLERGIDRHQVEYCLQNGVIDEPAHKNTKGNWQCCLRCNHAGDLIRVVAALEQDETERWVIVLTVFLRS